MHELLKKSCALLLCALMMMLFLLPAQAGEQPLGSLTLTEEAALEYATGFRLYRYEGGYASFTVDPLPDKVFLLVPQGQPVPEGLAENVVILQKPINSTAFNTSGMVSLVDAMGGMDRIKTVGTDRKGWYLSNVIRRMEAGDIVFSGHYKEPDFELLSARGIQLLVDTVRLAEHPEVMAKYDELGIPYVIESSSKEGHPLGRVEWVKLFGEIMDLQEQADAYFDAQAKLVSTVTAADKSGKTVAMVYLSSDGTKVFCRNGGDYMAAMIGLAGGEYIMADMKPDQTGTTSVTMEEFYTKCEQADYLFYVNHVQRFKTLEEMTAFNPLFKDLKAVKTGQVYITAPNFSQSTAAIAGIIADMHAILQDSSVANTGTLNKLP